MSTFRIQIDVASLIPTNINAVNASTFPALALAVDRVAGSAQTMWLDYAGGATLPDGRSMNPRTGRYRRSIQRAERGPFAAEIYSKLPYADVLEKGGPARDLKRMLDTSFKVRVNKKGRRYLIIPFRHDTPGATTEGRPMPKAVHELWQGMARSNVTGFGERQSGTGAYGIHTRRPIMVATRKYRWGDRLTKAQLAGAGVFGTQQRHLAGMVNLRNPTGRGGQSHSQYLTFRVMSEDSSGWIARARKGYWPAKSTADRLKPVAEKLFTEAVKADLRGYLGGLR